MMPYGRVITTEITFATFKSQLKSYEETEKFNIKTKTDQVMKADSPVAPLSNSLTCYMAVVVKVIF